MKMVTLAFFIVLMCGCGNSVDSGVHNADTTDKKLALEHFIISMEGIYRNWNNNDLTRKAFADSLDKQFYIAAKDSNLLEGIPFELDDIKRQGKDSNLVFFKYNKGRIAKANIPVYLSIAINCKDSIALSIDQNEQYYLTSLKVLKYQPSLSPDNFSYGSNFGMEKCDLGALLVKPVSIQKVP